MYFDEYYNVLFTQWFQKKTLKSTPLGFVPEFEHPESCVFLALGCYWAVGQGLMRPPGSDIPGTGLDRKSGFVFQDLHNMKDDNVTKQMSELIKSLVPVLLRQYYSVKSMRYGAMSQLMWDPAVAYEEAIALGGWSTATNSDWYTWIYLIAVIPAVLSLSGYPDCRVLPYLPSCTKCFAVNLLPEQRMTSDKWTAFLGVLFPNSLRDFRFPHGRLRPLMNHVAAVMVMHFKHFYLKYGIRNEYVKAMSRACQSAQMADNETQAINKLQLWSTIVKEDYKKGNTTGHDPNSDGLGGNLLRRRKVKDELAKINMNLAALLSRQSEGENQLLELQRAVEKTTYEVEQFRTWTVRVAELQEKLIKQNDQIILYFQSCTTLGNNRSGGLVTPSPGTQGNQRVQQSATSSVGTAVLETPLRAPPPVPPPLPPTGPPAPPPLPAPAPAPRISINDALHRTTELPKGKRGQRRENTSLDYMLKEWHNDPREANFRSLRAGGPALDDQCTWVHHHMFNADTKSKEKIRRTLQFMDCCWTAEERDQIINKRLDANATYQLHKAVVKRVINTAHVLKHPPPLSPTPTKAATGNILGLGNIILGVIKHLPDDLEKYVPKWGGDGSIRSRESLLAIAQRKRNSITAGTRNVYRRGAQPNRTTGLPTRRQTTTTTTAAAAPAPAGYGAGGGQHVI